MKSEAGFLGLMAGLMPPALAAEPLTGIQRTTGPDPLHVVLGLLLILCLIFLFFLILRRYASFTRLPPRQFEVLAQTSLGQRERIVLLQVGSKQLVLAVSPGRIETLCILEGEDTIPTLDSGSATSSSPLFIDKLAEAMRSTKA